MLLPNIPAWVKQAHSFAGCRVESGNIRTFETITMWASQRQVVFHSLAAVLLGDDVVYLKRQRQRFQTERTRVRFTVCRQWDLNPSETDARAIASR
jgi:hypothetical protein